MPVLETGGTVRELNGNETVIGSGANANWRLPGADLAAKHFIVALAGDGNASVRSCSTQNIVVVNGRQLGVRSLPLSDGDTISAGGAHFVYARNEAALQPARDPDASPAYLVDEKSRLAYPLAKRSVSIGRDSASIIALRDPQVSRFHADVKSEAGVYVLYSMGSAGTRVNGHGVAAPKVLESGDKLEIASHTFVFTRGDLPGGVKLTGGTSGEEGEWSRRRTMSSASHTGEVERAAEPGRRSPMLPIGMVILAVVVVLLIVRFVF